MKNVRPGSGISLGVGGFGQGNRTMKQRTDFQGSWIHSVGLGVPFLVRQTLQLRNLVLLPCLRQPLPPVRNREMGEANE